MPKLVGRSHRLRRRTRTSTIRHRQHKQRATVIGATGSGTLLERILSTPHVAHIVPQLQPEALYRVVKLCGLEDCGQLLTLATPGQLARVFDLDLWREAAPGLDEQFDADRFGSWVAVMVDADVAHAATTLAAMDVDLVATGFAQHVRVFDYAAASPFITLDGGVTPGMDVSGIAHCEIAGYLVCARQTGWWDAVTMALHALSEGHSPYFNQIRHARTGHVRRRRSA